MHWLTATTLLSLRSNYLTFLFIGFIAATPEHPGRGASFPGPWARYYQAPASRRVLPIHVWKTIGRVRHAQGILDGSGATLSRGDFVTVAFEQNIAGLVAFSILQGSTWDHNSHLKITYSESSLFIGHESDATGDRVEHDVPLDIHIQRYGDYTVDASKLRGAFKYLSFYVDRGDCNLIISNISVFFTAMPHWQEMTAYTGYFESSDELLNRIWYAGAYTLQLCTIDPRQGSSLVDYNRDKGHGNYPETPGFWASNYTISNGSSVITDGAKRDRMYYSGDASVAIPSIAVSTYDLISVRNGLNALFEMMYDSGELPYASPPMGFNGEFSDTYHLHTLLGVHHVFHYTGDRQYLRKVWPHYIKALDNSIRKVDSTGLMKVTSGNDWLRPALQGHAIEPNAILFLVLGQTMELAKELEDEIIIGRCDTLRKALQHGILALWDDDRELFFDNLEGRNDVFPQDGNVWAVKSHIVDYDRAQRISSQPHRRWGKYGAPAVELSDTISPFISSIELQAHVMAGRPQTALELMRRQWGYMLDGSGFTNSTLVEGFSTNGNVRYPAYNIDARNSHAHGWSAGPTHVLSEQILGLKLTSPAGKSWAVEPYLCDLDWMRGGYSTSLGRFEVQLDHNRLRVTTPAGTHGVVRIWNQTVSLSGGSHELLFRGTLVDDVRHYAEAFVNQVVS